MVTKTARRKTSGLRFAVFGLTLLGFICNGACTGAPGPAAGDNSTPDQPLRHPQRIISLTLGTSELDGGVRHHPARGHLLRGIPERGRRARVLRTGKISIEKILSINPDAILIGTGYNRNEGFRDRLLGDSLFAPLDAVRRRRVVALPSRQLTAVSHHLADCVTALRDVMAEISIAKTVPANHKNNHGRIRK